MTVADPTVVPPSPEYSHQAVAGSFDETLELRGFLERVEVVIRTDEERYLPTLGFQVLRGRESVGVPDRRTVDGFQHFRGGAPDLKERTE